MYLILIIVFSVFLSDTTGLTRIHQIHAFFWNWLPLVSILACFFMFELILLPVGVHVFVGLFGTMPNTSFAKHGPTVCDGLFTGTPVLCPLSSVSCVLWVSYLVSAAHKTGSSIHLTHTHLNPTIHLLLVGVQPVSKWEFDSGNALNNFSDLLVL